MKEFIVSRRLALKAALFVDVEPWYSLEKVRQKLGDGFINLLSGYAALRRIISYMRKRDCTEAVIIESSGYPSDEMLVKLQRDFGLPENWKRFYIRLCREFAIWLKGLGGVFEANWGRVVLYEDGSVKLFVPPLKEGFFTDKKTEAEWVEMPTDDLPEEK